jgi:hypothetical protein
MPDQDNPRPSRIQVVADVLMKLTVPVATIVAAVLASGFAARSSLQALISQREQSDTNLRATMFGQLIGPIVGPAKDGTQMPDPLQYALLVKLLALNFHEHFEFGPLMQSASDRLAATTAKLNPETIESARQDLRSVAHRIIERQISSLGRDPVQTCSPNASAEVTFRIFSSGYPDAKFAERTKDIANDKSVFFYRLGQSSGSLPLMTAPNCKDALKVSFLQADWQIDSIDIRILRNPAAAETAQDWYDFQVTPFSFPFSDNTLFDDGNRFAFYQTKVERLDEKIKDVALMEIKLRWFPQYFYPPTERPSNGKEVQQRLGVGAGAL